LHRQLTPCRIENPICRLQAALLRRLARGIDGRFLPVDARNIDAPRMRIAPVIFVIHAAAAASISTTMHLLALVAAATVRRTNALSAPNLRPRTVQHLRPRTVRLDDAWSVTVYERDDIAANVEAWMATDDNVVDPFGGVAWPGAVIAARKLRDHGVAGKVVCCLGCGTGVEVLAAASLNASRVIALDYSHEALALCDAGAENYTCVETRNFDVRRDTLPACDVLVAADVFYSKDLSIACGRACGAALRTKKRPVLISTDSQRYAGHTDAFLEALDVDFARFERTTLPDFVGSGLLVEGDQTYDAHIDVLMLDFAGADDEVFTTARVLPGGCVGLWSHHKARIGGGKVEALLAAFGRGDGLVRLAKKPDGSIVAAYRERRTCERMDVITLPCPPRPPGVPLGVKHGAWGGYRAAIAEAQRRGADAALLTDEDGCIVDGDRALPVILGADGILRHPGPADGAVASATLAAVLKEAPPCEVREERLSMEMILNAREVVLLGSGVGCVAVKSVDGVALDNTSGDELVSTFSEALDAAHTSDALRPRIEHPMLRRLKIGEEVGHIRRLASKPSAFYVRSLLSPRDCEAIQAMAHAANMTQARTYGGGTTARTKCEVSWISPPPALTYDVSSMFFSPEALERPGGGCDAPVWRKYRVDGVTRGAYGHHTPAARETPQRLKFDFHRRRPPGAAVRRGGWVFDAPRRERARVDRALLPEWRR
jgi:predicted nicotinamide N-methyase